MTRAVKLVLSRGQSGFPPPLEECFALGERRQVDLHSMWFVALLYVFRCLTARCPSCQSVWAYLLHTPRASR